MGRLATWKPALGIAVTSVGLGGEEGRGKKNTCKSGRNMTIKVPSSFISPNHI